MSIRTAVRLPSSLPHRALAWSPMALMAAGAGLAAAGQALLGDPPQTPYLFTVHSPLRLTVGVALLLAGAALFGLAASRSDRRPAASSPDEDAASPTAGRWSAGLLAALCAGVVASGALLLFGTAALLTSAEYEPSAGWSVLGAVAFGGVSCALWDRARGVRWRRGVRPWEAVFLVLVVAAFVTMNGADATHWYYSAIGDEYAFYEAARRIAEGGAFNPFQQGGIYDDQPVLSSALQGLAMKALGTDHFGWKMSSVLAVAATFPFFYLLVARLWGRRTAAVATVVLASSHALFGYAHTGYNNVQALPVTLAAFWLFVAAQDRRSALLVFLAGVTAGLGFYTIYTARVAAAVLVVVALVAHRGRPPSWVLMPGAAAALLAVAPLFAENGAGVIGLMLDRTVVEYLPGVVGDPVQRVLLNVPVNLIAFNYNVQPHHYVTGSLLDPASAALAALGVGALLADLPRRRALFVVVWWTLGMVAVGLFSPYPHAAPSRLHYLTPLYALAAGVALVHLSSILGPRGLAPAARVRTYLVPIGLVMMALASIVALNVYRFRVESPRQAPIAVEALAVRATRTALCGDGATGTPLVVGGNGDTLKSAFRSFPGQPMPRFLTPEAYTADVTASSVEAVCVVLVPPADALAPAAEAALAASPTGVRWGTQEVRDGAGAKRVIVLYRR